MTARVAHAFVSAIADSSVDLAAGKVTPQTHWNADHTFLLDESIVRNGGMVLNQRPATTMTASYAYTDVDAWKVKCATTGATVGQAAAAAVGRTGYALKVTAYAAADPLKFTTYIESKDAIRLNNATASFSCLARTNASAGSPLCSIIVSKANAVDNFSAVTTVATGTGFSVATNTNTLVKLENVSMGDCSNGIQIEIVFAFVSATSGNFWITEVTANEGAFVAPFVYVPYDRELQRARRYFESSFDPGVVPSAGQGSQGYKFAHAFATTDMLCREQFRVPKRTGTPTVTIYKDNAVGTGGGVNVYNSGWTGQTYTVYITSANDFSLDINSGTWTSGWTYPASFYWTADADF